MPSALAVAVKSKMIRFDLFALLQAITWMEKKLTSSNVTLILVTHDRVFMEAVCTGVLELDQGLVHAHAFGGPGSYERFCQVHKQSPWLLCRLLPCMSNDLCLRPASTAH